MAPAALQSTGVEATHAAAGAMSIDDAALRRLLAYMRAVLPPALLPAAVTALRVRQFGHGQSNPTYLLECVGDGGAPAPLARFVLRKKPPGTLLASAHAVEREFAVMQALGRATPRMPVPRVHALCTDDRVLGTPFFLMEHVVGRCAPLRAPGAPVARGCAMLSAACTSPTRARTHAHA